MILGVFAAALAAGPMDPTPAPPGTRFEREEVPPALYEGTVDRPPVELFRKRLPGERVPSGSHSERSRPVVYGDLVLVGSAGGSALYGLSRRDGRLVTSWPAMAPVQSAVVIDGADVLFNDTAGATWRYGLDGELRWTRRGTAPILVEPTVVDGVVYVADVEDLVVALDASSGELLWRYRHPPDLGRTATLALYASPPPTVVDGSVYCGFSDGSVVVLDAETGDELWSVKVGEGAYPDVVGRVEVVGNDVIASGYFSPFVAIDRTTRNIRWRVDAGTAAAVAVDRTGEDPVLLHSGTDGILRAVDARTGAVIWTWDSGRTGALSEVVPTPAGLLVGSAEGGLYLVDRDSGAEVWRYRGPTRLNGVTPAPTVAGRQVLAVTNAGNLVSLVSPLDLVREDRRPWPATPDRRRGPLD